MARLPRVLTVQQSSLIRLYGKQVYIPPLCALLQTDGSFRGPKSFPRGRCAAWLATATGSDIYTNTWILSDAGSSTETEWASVAHGLEFAISHSEGAVGIENDNLGVVAGLLGQSQLRHEYMRYYKYRIDRAARGADWIGIRWIPRKENNADALLQ